MAIEHNLHNSYMFSSELENIVVTGVTTALSFAVKLGDDTVFNSVFVPGNDNVVRIYDISSIVNTYITEYFADFTFIIGAESVDIRVFKSKAPVAESALSFITSYFLSSAMAPKISALNRYEVLSFYTSEACEVYAEAYYYAQGLVTHRYTLLAVEAVTLDAVNTVDVSPVKFIDYSLGELISYTVIAGRRRFTFNLLDGLPVAEPAVIFRNNFGVWETFYFMGTQEMAPEIKRSLAYINGKYSLYDIDEQQLYKAKTGILLGGLLPIALDLGRSHSIFMLNSDGAAGDEIVFTAEEEKFANDDNALPSFSFTYRRSRRNSALVAVVRPPKLFDNTFDNTFD